MAISIQGYQGSFHHIVARKLFGPRVKVLERDTFGEVFEDIMQGKAPYGLIAIENSLTGSILENYDLLLQYRKIYIIDEAYLRISQHLISWPDNTLRDILTVHSHPVALKQCARFLQQHPEWKVREETDTAGSVKMLRDKKMKHGAAIASSLAAELYHMKILAPGIEMNKKNYTRFLVLSKTPANLKKAGKTSLVFETENKPGSLANILNAFADAKINLSKIESRPMIGSQWHYHFYLDFEAGLEDPRAQKVLQKIKKHILSLRILGSYPKGKTISKS